MYLTFYSDIFKLGLFLFSCARLFAFNRLYAATITPELFHIQTCMYNQINFIITVLEWFLGTCNASFCVVFPALYQGQ